MQLRIFTEPQQGASYDDLLAVAQAAERLGFDGFFRSDHYLVMGGGDGLPGPTDAWVTLAGLARDTTRLRLGTLVTSATFRLPGPLAVSVAEVDHMSGGRVELGLGAGWYEAEHRAYAIPFPPLGERFERLEEQLAIITGLWGTPAGERFSYTGRHYEVTDSPALPKPRQQPRPPVIVGGHGPSRTPRLAATYADEFNLAFPRWRSSPSRRPGSGRPARRSAAIPRPSSSLPRSCCAAVPTAASSNAAPPPSVANPRSCASTAPPGRPTRSSPRSPAGGTPGLPACISRSST